MVDLIYKEEAYRIVGACFEVYNEKGPGFVEPVYQECLEIELTMQGIPYVRKPELQLCYKGKPLTCKYIPDLVCFGEIIIELKAVSNLLDEHRAQLHNYLKATGCRLGILLNFSNHPGLHYERIVR